MTQVLQKNSDAIKITRFKIGSIVSALLACMFVGVAIPRYGNLIHIRAVAAFSGVLSLLSWICFPLLLCLLLVVVWRAVRSAYIDKMEGWWWLCVPYSVAFPGSIVFFHMQEFTAPLALFVLPYFASAPSSFLWALVAAYTLVAHTNESQIMWKRIMLVFGIVAASLAITVSKWSS